VDWQQLRSQYPDCWVLVEATKAHSSDGERVLDELALIARFDDSDSAMRDYQRHHHAAPQREFYVLHTNRSELDIRERRWIGARGR